MIQLEPRFVDYLAAEYGRLGGLHGVIGRQPMNPAIEQVQITDTLILNIVAGEAVTHSEGVILAELIVDAGADAQAILGRFEDRIKGIFGQRIGIEREGVDDVPVMDIAFVDIHEKRRFLAERAAQVSAVFAQQEWRFLLRVRIARVEDVVAEIEIRGAVILVGARLGENLDSPVAELVEFRREGVLVDADLANGIFRGQRPAGETIDVDLSSAWPGRRAS